MKFRKILTFILILTILSTTLIACAKNEENSIQSRSVTVADFEQWSPDFQLIRVLNSFGKIYHFNHSILLV